MYKIKRSSFKEYKRVCLNSYEPGEPLYCEDYEFYKLVYNKDIICIMGHKCGQVGDSECRTFLIGSFTHFAEKHVRALVEVGRWYLSIMGDMPIEISVEKGNKRFERFAKFFGFKKTLAQNVINGIMYTTYMRMAK